MNVSLIGHVPIQMQCVRIRKELTIVHAMKGTLEIMFPV